MFLNDWENTQWQRLLFFLQMFKKTVGHMYKLSRPQVMVSTVVDSQTVHNNSETHILCTHTHMQVSPMEKPFETTPTGSATFLKKFPDMSFSAHQGHRQDNHSSLSPRVHSTAWGLLRAMPLPESRSQQHILSSQQHLHSLGCSFCGALQRMGSC